MTAVLNHDHAKYCDLIKKYTMQDFSQFEYAAIAVEPHTTHGGFLFYDVQGLGSNPLHGALLELRTVRNADGKELRYFDIPFDKYLQARTK